ncbi:MAG: hypothetical protein AAFX10_17860, partial [Pseudomonadota bacterium]
AFLLRALIPLGYMPGNLLAGEFARLCPSVLPEATLADSHHGHHGHGEADPVASTSQQCEFSVAASLSITVSDCDDVIAPGPAAVERPSRQRGHTASRHRNAYRPRAPPPILV